VEGGIIEEVLLQVGAGARRTTSRPKTARQTDGETWNSSIVANLDQVLWFFGSQPDAQSVDVDRYLVA
jgi:hypothetical protein